jgi:hypothetical protein
VKEKRLCVSEKIVVVVLLASLVYPIERCESHSKTNLGTSMRAGKYENIIAELNALIR